MPVNVSIQLYLAAIAEARVGRCRPFCIARLSDQVNQKQQQMSLEGPEFSEI